MTTHDPTPRHYEREPRLVETFAVIDLDRTLLNTGALVELLYAQFHEHGFTAEQITGELAFIEQQTGTSFSLFEYIETTHSKDLLESILEKVLLLAEDGVLDGDTLLCAGADRLLELLEYKDVPHAILTYGNELDQAFKLSLIRKLLGKTANELPAAITDEPKKAAWISATWDDVDQAGGIAVPEAIAGETRLRARNIVVIDDKQGNLDSDNPAVMGILVNNSEARPSSSTSTADLVEYLEAGMPLTNIAHFQAMHH